MSSLFIGLGGVGSGTLDCLYDKMVAYNKDLVDQGRAQVEAFYYYIDTESARYDQHPEEFMGNGNKKFHQIGQKSPESIKTSFQRSDSKKFDLLQKWYDAPPKTTNMIQGADTIRQYSRLALNSEIDKIRGELEPLVRRVSPHPNDATQEHGRIYVITGSCGGTGCGVYMDILYLISEIYEHQNTAANSTDVRLIIAMPEGYVSDGNFDVQYKKKKLNAFATLMELNALCKAKDFEPSLFNDCYIGSIKKNGVFQPFRYGYMYDSAGQKRDEVSQKLSDFLFELELAGDTSNGIHENQNNNYNGSFLDSLLTGTVDGNWNASIDDKYVKAFNAMGQYSIEKPDFLYRRYFSDRLLFDVFHYGLIGKNEAIDQSTITRLAGSFKNEYDAEITNTCNSITSRIVSRNDFANDAIASNTFSVFTVSPNMQEETVRRILERKYVLLQTVKDLVYRKCKEWLCQYDITTVYGIVNDLDQMAYKSAVDTNNEFENQLANAKKASIGGFLKKKINPEKALNEFAPLLNTWLTFEVNKALSSGEGVDITVQNQGYLDHCKTFIDTAKHNFTLNKEQEHWDEIFVKNVSELKAKEDVCYLPDLSEIVNEQCRIIHDCNMVQVYENNVLVNPLVADLTKGTCTPVMLHNKIIEEMKGNDESLKQEGLDMDELFDPMPGKRRNLRNASNATLFVEKYVAEARKQINKLLSSNQSYQNLFVEDILTRLQNLPENVRVKKCLDFVNYNKVQLKTEDMTEDAVTQYTYYILSSVGNRPLMKELGIFDVDGRKKANTDHTPENPFFSDKIVKLIIKNGYKVDDYRYFGEYNKYVADEMKEGQTHDPFIDKRFLGMLDKDGKYPCDVSCAMKKIAEGEIALKQAQEFSLDEYNDVEIYKFGVALLYVYFDTLKQSGNRIDSGLEDAITRDANAVTIRQATYSKLRKKYVLGEPKTIDLDTISTIVNSVNFTDWINIIQSKKDSIENESELYTKAIDVFNLSLSGDLEVAIENMMGDSRKPKYDFFKAYLNWYNKLK